MGSTQNSQGAQRTRRGFATVIGVVGEIMLTLGIVVVLFACYQLWWTNVVSAQQTSAARAQALELFATDAGQTPPVGTPFALMYIPRLRDHVWELPVIQGVEKDQLARGVGHYPQTAMPGQVGNFAVAAHRATHGEPFANFDQLKVGDRVYVRTATAWFTYELKRDQIVSPADIWTIGPQPFGSNAFGTDKLITLTTCHPRWASTYRWIFWGTQIGQSPADAPPAGVG